MLRNGHVRFGGRVGETDRRQRRHRAPTRPYEVIPRLRVPELTLDDRKRDPLGVDVYPGPLQVATTTLRAPSRSREQAPVGAARTAAGHRPAE